MNFGYLFMFIHINFRIHTTRMKIKNEKIIQAETVYLSQQKNLVNK